jgi:hypothetical protein
MSGTYSRSQTGELTDPLRENMNGRKHSEGLDIAGG